MHTDVLIVGAGPTGLMLANQLAKRGIEVIIVDRNHGPSVQTKALGVQARTLEIYSHLGIAERAIKMGRRATGASMWVKGRRAARVPLGDIGAKMSPYPFLLILGQDDNEKLLGETLHAQGTDVLWNTSLVDFVQTPEGVSAKLDHEGESTVEITARWIAGCDGAHSTVRSVCNIPFLGAPYQHVFYVADTYATGSVAWGKLNVYLWRGGFHLIFPDARTRSLARCGDRSSRIALPRQPELRRDRTLHMQRRGDWCDRCRACISKLHLVFYLSCASQTRGAIS